MSGTRATLRSVSELRGRECEILREKRLSGGREQHRNSRMVLHGSGWCREARSLACDIMTDPGRYITRHEMQYSRDNSSAEVVIPHGCHHL